MSDPAIEYCGDEIMGQLLAEVDVDAGAALARIDRLLVDFPLDPRLHFLKGSLLVGLKRFVGAHLAMSRALEIAPDYDLARFQLGFFELTSGEPEAALRTWAPLDALEPDSWMYLFVDGLRALAEDRFMDCVTALRAGIAANEENLPLNRDMELIITECERLRDAGPAEPEADGEEAAEMTATSFLLGNAASRRRH